MMMAASPGWSDCTCDVICVSAAARGAIERDRGTLLSLITADSGSIQVLFVACVELIFCVRCNLNTSLALFHSLGHRPIG